MRSTARSTQRTWRCMHTIYLNTRAVDETSCGDGGERHQRQPNHHPTTEPAPPAVLLLLLLKACTDRHADTLRLGGGGSDRRRRVASGLHCVRMHVGVRIARNHYEATCSECASENVRFAVVRSLAGWLWVGWCRDAVHLHVIHETRRAGRLAECARKMDF